MGQKHNDWVNARTGEEASGIAFIKGKRYPKGVEFVTMFKEGLEYLATLKLTPTESAVFFHLCSRLDYENWLSISQETIAQDLGIDRPNVTVAIRRLVEAEVLEASKNGTDKRRNAYRFNARLGWKGDASQWGQHMAAKAGSNVIPMPGVKLPTPPAKPKRTRKPPSPAAKSAEQIEREKLEAEGQQRLF